MTINTYDIFAIIGITVSGLLAIIAIGFCYWLIFAEIIRFLIKRLKVYKYFIQYILNRKQFYEFMGKEKGE